MVWLLLGWHGNYFYLNSLNVVFELWKKLSMSSKHLVLMHNYLSPKLCAMEKSLPRTTINITCFAQYNDFSPRAFYVFNQINILLSVLNFSINIYSQALNCKRNVKDIEIFKPADQGIHLQKSAIGLKKHSRNSYSLYLAAKGNYLTTNSTTKDAQTIATSLASLNIGYKRSNNTTHYQIYQKDCTLFFNRVLDHTGRLYIKTIRKNQSKKSNPWKQDRRNWREMSALHNITSGIHYFNPERKKDQQFQTVTNKKGL